MDAVTLSAVAGGALSLILSYTPKLAPKYQALAPDTKRLVMLVLLALVAGASYGLGCAKIDLGIGAAVTCDQAGVITAIKSFGAAVITNQSAYIISPGVAKPEAAKSAG